jgi:hypothetical protein
VIRAAVCRSREWIAFHSARARSGSLTSRMVWVQASRSAASRARSSQTALIAKTREPAEAGVLGLSDPVLDSGVGAVASF